MSRKASDEQSPQVRSHGPWVDLHAHPGKCFFGDTEIFDAARALKSAGVAASSFSTVGDLGILAIRPDGIVQTREFEPGEARRDHDNQLLALGHLGEDDDVLVIRKAADVQQAHDEGLAGAFFTAEGADFLGEDLADLERVYRCGLRSVTLVHYSQNLTGDLQTAPSKHGGLSGFGRELVLEMNRLGMIVDLAHASFQTTLDAIQTSTAPVIISHSHLAAPGADHPRLLSADHALAVAQSGGLIGAWPSGVASETFDDFVDEICRLIDLLGIGGVAIGTDLDGNYKPVLTRHDQYADLDRALETRGLSPEERDAVLGGNVVAMMAKVL